MRIIDVHAHLGRDLSDDLSQTPSELLAKMDKAGIERSVVFPFEGGPDVVAENERVLEAAVKHRDRLIPFWAIVPTVPPTEREELANRVAAAAKRTDGIKGIVLNPTMHTYKIAHPYIVRLCEMMGGLGMPVMLHHTGTWGDEMGSVPDLVRRCPSVNFIVPNPTWTAGAVTLFKDFPNVYYDVSKSYGDVTYRILADAVGTGRLLFGSEAPKMDAGFEITKLRAYKFSEDELHDVAFRNAARLLRVA